jgi:hypothetical protein
MHSDAYHEFDWQATKAARRCEWFQHRMVPREHASSEYSATRAPSHPHCPVGLTDRSGSLLRVAHRTASYPVGRTVQFRGENRRDSRLSRGENRLNY